VGEVLEATLDTVQKQVKKGEKVSLPGFGTFERRARSKVPAFKAGATFKSFVNGSK
jgi:DNA-binding protein HU-beta